MDIQHIDKQRLTSNQQSEAQYFKKGSIVRGKILKLFPQNKAHIQLGAHTFIAQLEAPLQLGASYHFQVQSAEDVLRLRVLGERRSQQNGQNIQQLLQQLHIKPSKLNTSFMNQLIKEGIPFTREQFAQALTRLDQTANKQQGIEVIKDMMIRKWPISEEIFRALITKRSGQLSGQLHHFGESIQRSAPQTSLEQQLSQKITQLTRPHEPALQQLKNQMYTDVHNHHYQNFNLFKAAQIVDQNVSYSDWQSFWVRNKNSGEKILDPPFRFDSIRAAHMVSVGDKLSEDIRQQAQSILSKWIHSVSNTQQETLNQRDFQLLKQDIQRQLLPLLSYNAKELVEAHLENKNKNASLQQLMGYLEELSSSRTNVLTSNAVDTFERAPLMLSNPKQTFLNHIRRVTRMLGITYEQQLMANLTHHKQEATIKSLLIRMISHSEGHHHEQAQQLLNFINGLQLESIQETPHFIQANLQLPGAQLGLNEDLFLEFESQKTADEKINADYCRIVFYLNLAYLKQTVIDMQVHNRIVSLTVYADQQNRIEHMSETMQPVLKDRLEKLDYKLTGVAIKSLLSNNEKKHGKILKTDMPSTYEGIDFRI